VSNAELLASAHRLLPGGSLGLFRLPDEVAFVGRSGQGAWLTDVEGRRYLDFLQGYGPLILGHAHPAVVAAVQERVALGTHFYLLNDEAIRLAEALVAAIPCAEQVRFCGSGSEATFFALRLARAFTRRSKILSFEGAFHGTHDYAQPRTAGVPAVLRGEMLSAPFNDLETATSLIAQHAAELAAVLVEPLQRCIPPTPGFLAGLRQASREHGVLLVLDEVVTGFRLAYGGAQEYYGVEADLACYGKIVGGGLPLAAVAGRAEILQLADVRRMRRPDYAMVGGTLAGNPLAAAAGLATLAELRQPGLYERLHANGNRLRTGLEELGRRHGLPIRAGGEGPVFQPLITEVEPVDAASQAQADQLWTYRFGLEMVRRGVLLLRTVFPATVHGQAEVDQALTVADEVLAGLATRRSCLSAGCAVGAAAVARPPGPDRYWSRRTRPRGRTAVVQPRRPRRRCSADPRRPGPAMTQSKPTRLTFTIY
jgi:glutamate-1-semialdehyde 2,1-aminomutase